MFGEGKGACPCSNHRVPVTTQEEKLLIPLYQIQTLNGSRNQKMSSEYVLDCIWSGVCMINLKIGLKDHLDALMHSFNKFLKAVFHCSGFCCLQETHVGAQEVAGTQGQCTFSRTAWSPAEEGWARRNHDVLPLTGFKTESRWEMKFNCAL